MNISFLTEDELEQIDNKIEYKNGTAYLDDLLKKLREKFDHIEEFLRENQHIAIELLGDKYDGKQLSNDEKIDLKLKYISKYLNNRRYLNGFVDLVMFSDIVIKELFSEEERSKMHSYSFFVDEENLQNTELADILTSTETRKRGRVREKQYFCQTRIPSTIIKILKI